MAPIRISLLLPTYNRPAELRQTLASIEATVARRDLLQTVLYLAQDDPAAAEYSDIAGSLWAHGDMVIWGPHVFYKGLPLAFERLAEYSSGAWLFPFADDVTCNTPGWDDVIRRYDHTVPTLLVPDNEGGFPAWFPIISRRTWEVLGGMPPTMFNDVWLGEVFDRALPGNVHRSIPVRFTDRIVAGFSLSALPAYELAEYRRTVDAGVASLTAFAEVA